MLPSPSARVGTPKSPDPSLYAHLSEKDRMLEGWPYVPTDPVLTLDRNKGHGLCREYNKCEGDEGGKKTEILKKLLHPGCKNFDKMYIEPPFQIDYGYNLKVGENFYANFNCVILDCALVEMGDNVMLAPGVQIYTATHPLDPHYREPGPGYFELAAPIKIGNNCWIGGEAIICPGVTIGNNVVVGAGSVVNRDVPDNVVVAGNPAKIVRYLDGAVVPPDVLERFKSSGDRRMPTPSARVGTPKYPDSSLYAHLSEKDRMLGAWPYLPADPALTLERNICHKLCRELNKCEVDEGAKKTEILTKLMHPGCKNVDKFWIEPPFQLDYGYNFKVGENFQANFNCIILDSALIEIGDNALLAPGVQIYSATHPIDPQYREMGPKYFELAAPIKIGNNCWIGGMAIICPGVTIGDNVVVGAGTVVNRDIPDNVVVAGNPARIVRYLDGVVVPPEVLERLKK